MKISYGSKFRLGNDELHSRYEKYAPNLDVATMNSLFRSGLSPEEIMDMGDEDLLCITNIGKKRALAIRDVFPRRLKEVVPIPVKQILDLGGEVRQVRIEHPFADTDNLVSIQLTCGLMTKQYKFPMFCPKGVRMTVIVEPI